MTGTRVAADWAWISKDAQAGIGSSVLATSRGEVDFRPFIGRFVPGSPSSSTPPEAPEAPPWVTVGPVVMQSGEILMTVSVREPSAERDHAGRAVWPHKLFVVGFDELARANASFQTISETALGTELPVPEHGMMPLGIAGQSPDELIRTIEAYGFEQFAALATAVLEGPVVLAETRHLDRRQRLAILDAVAALLPYGFRAGLSVSSVVDNTSKHEIRLAFAEFAGKGQRLLPLPGPAAEPRTEVATRYLKLLKEKECAPGLGLAPLVEYLWSLKEPHSFDNPETAITALVDLDFYGAFRREASHGPVPLGMLLKFLAQPDAARRAWAGLDVRMRDNTLASYLPGRSVKAAQAVIPYWGFLGNDVIRLINRGLDANSLDSARWCLGTAGPVEDRMLGDLLVPDEDVRRDRATVLIELLRQRDAPQPDQFRYTCDQLRYDDATAWQARLVRDLLIRELAEERTADRGKAWAWVWWLCESQFTAKWRRPDWVTALDFVASGPPSRQAVAGVRSLIPGDARWTVVLIRLASQSRCLDQLIGSADEQLVRLGLRVRVPLPPDGTGAMLLAELKRDLWALAVRPGAVAGVDVVRTLLGGEPRDFPGDFSDDVLDGYFDGLRAALGLPAMQPRLAEVVAGVLKYVIPGQKPRALTAGSVRLLNTWSAEPRLRGCLLDYIESMDPAAYPYHPGLNQAFWNALRQRPALAAYAAGNQLIIIAQEAVRDARAALRRPLTEEGQTSTALARACLNARRAGLSMSGIVRALALAEASAIGARQLDDVLREFQDLRHRENLDASGTGQVAPDDTPDAAENDLFDGWRLIVQGGLGDPFAEEFSRNLVSRLRAEILTREWVLRNVVPGQNVVPAGQVRERPRASGRGTAVMPSYAETTVPAYAETAVPAYGEAASSDREGWFRRLSRRARRPWRKGDSESRFSSATSNPPGGD